jgi:hypothetical protein
MGLDFDIRYKQVLTLLNTEKIGKVLEVGALPPACLSNYIGKNVDYVGINMNYSNKKYRIKRLDFLSNKFEDKYFSHSISTDTLEHVRPAKRGRFIKELCRVTQNTIILGVPNPEAREYEKILLTLLGASKEGRHYIKFFKEHEYFGIPSREEMHSYLLGYHYTTIENFSLRYWIPILLSDVFGSEINLKKIEGLDKKPAYRTFYIIKK